MGKNQVKTWCLDLLFLVVGSMVYAVEVNVFTAPNNIAAGGITGIATMLKYLFGTPIGLVSFLINAPIVVWAVMEIGWKLVAKTLAAIFLTSVMIDLFSKFLPVYRGDPILVALCAGALEGVGLSLIFIRGATTGGTDLVARLLGRRLPHLSMGKLMLAVDGVIVAVSAFVYGSIENAIYACIVIFVSTRLIDAFLYGVDAGTGKLFLVMSPKVRAWGTGSSGSWSARSRTWTLREVIPGSRERPCSAWSDGLRCTICSGSSERRTKTPLSLWGRQPR